MDPELSFNYLRKFGVELEVLSSDHRNFQDNPLGPGESPEGSGEIANLVVKVSKRQTSINRYSSTHHNTGWVVKPDRSCGIEICSPVLKGVCGIDEVARVVHAMRKNGDIDVDTRCGLHVHVDASDCTTEERAKILTWWVKCETVFLDSVPTHRKKNRYCQQIGIHEAFQHDSEMRPSDLIKLLGENKYHTINCYHMYHRLRDTVEFRIGEGSGCLDAFFVKNWVRLLIHFVETAKRSDRLRMYREGDPMTSFCWLDPKQVMTFLGFIGLPLSKGMEEVRNWFLARIKVNLNSGLMENQIGIWTKAGRAAAKRDIDWLWSELGLKDPLDYLIPNHMEEALKINRN